MTEQAATIHRPQYSQPITVDGELWVCAKHGPRPIETEVLPWLAGNLPFPLALLLSEYLREESPFIKLHRLTDAEVRTVAPTTEGRRQELVEVMSRASAELGKKVLFLIDGLDEINRIDSSFVSLLFAASAPRVVSQRH